MANRSFFAFLAGVSIGATLTFLALHPSYTIWSRQELLHDIVNRDQAKGIAEYHWRLTYQRAIRKTNEELTDAGRAPLSAAFWEDLETNHVTELAALRDEQKQGLSKDYEGFTLWELMESRDFLLSPAQEHAAAFEVRYAKRNAELNLFLRQEYQDLAVNFFKSKVSR